jgi:hypothetical protein
MILYIKILVYYVILYNMTILNIMTRYNGLKIALVSTDTTSLPISAYHRCPGLEMCLPWTRASVVCGHHQLEPSAPLSRSRSRLARPCCGNAETRTNVAQLAVRRDPAIPLHQVERAPQPASGFIPSLVSHFTAEES